MSKYLSAKDYIPLVAKRAGFTNAVARKVLNAWRDVLRTEVANGHAVVWFGVGRFYAHVEQMEDFGTAVRDDQRRVRAIVRLKIGRAWRTQILPLADRNITVRRVKMGRIITPGAIKGRLNTRIQAAERQLESLTRVVGDDERAEELRARLAGKVQKAKTIQRSAKKP